MSRRMGIKPTRAKIKNMVIDCDSEDGSSLKPSNVLDSKNSLQTNWGKKDAAELEAEYGFRVAVEIYLPLHGKCTD